MGERSLEGWDGDDDDNEDDNPCATDHGVVEDVTDKNFSAGWFPMQIDEGRQPEPETRLLRIRRTGNKTNVFEVLVSRGSLFHGDCFILTDGKTIYTWMGEEASPFKKNACAMHAENLARERHGHVAEPDGRFWNLLGEEEPVR